MSMFTRYRELSLSIVVSAATLLENVCLIVQDSLLEFMPNAASNSDGDLPLAIWNFWEIPWTLTWLPKISWTPCYAPWLWKAYYWNVFPSEVILSIERISVHRISIINFSTIWTNSHMQAMIFFLKNAKLMSFLKFENSFLVKQTNFVKVWYQFKIYSEP